MSDVLRWQNYHHELEQAGSRITILHRIDLSVQEGEILGITGESGSGKTTLARAVLRCDDHVNWIHRAGSIYWDGRDLLAMRPAQLNEIRGREIGMVFQDPYGVFNPVRTIRAHIADKRAKRNGRRPDDVLGRARELLARLRFRDPDRVLRSYPHELSGGMRQRVLLALALLDDPTVLLADEVTSALDVVVIRHVLDALREIQRERGMSIVLISHDIRMLTELADRIAVMYAGTVLEVMSRRGRDFAPAHPYTRQLLNCQRSRKKGQFDYIPGLPPDPQAILDGCPFYQRCTHSERDVTCRESLPRFRGQPGSLHRCHKLGPAAEDVSG